LEIEFKDAKKLLVEAEKESRGEKNWYLQGVQGLLNNVRESIVSSLFFPFIIAMKIGELMIGCTLGRYVDPECE
jgi:hypothetical protein